MAYTCYLISDEDRENLLQKIPPIFPDIIAHHITERFGSTFPMGSECQIVGYIINEELAVQCLVVDIDGKSKRPDGKNYHITWSIDRSKGAKPVDSNKAIELAGEISLISPIYINVFPHVEE